MTNIISFRHNPKPEPTPELDLDEKVKLMPYKPKNRPKFHLEIMERHGSPGPFDCSTARRCDDDRFRYLILSGEATGIEILLSVPTDQEGAVEYLRNAGNAVLTTIQMTVAELVKG